MILKNITSQVQEIHKIKGEPKRVEPGDQVMVIFSEHYKEELDRIKPFFVEVPGGMESRPTVKEAAAGIDESTRPSRAKPPKKGKGR